MPRCKLNKLRPGKKGKRARFLEEHPGMDTTNFRDADEVAAGQSHSEHGSAGRDITAMVANFNAVNGFHGGLTASLSSIKDG